jgi:hypothetical protein
MKFAVALCLVAAFAWGQEGTGPFPAILEQDPSLPTHTVYRPQDLSKPACRRLSGHASWPRLSARPCLEPGAAAAPATKSSQLLDAINWALAENDRKGSPYNGKLGASKIAVMGMSCGEIQSYVVATDPRVKLVGIFNSVILLSPNGPGAPAMEDVRKDQLDKLHSLSST